MTGWGKARETRNPAQKLVSNTLPYQRFARANRSPESAYTLSIPGTFPTHKCLCGSGPQASTQPTLHVQGSTFPRSLAIPNIIYRWAFLSIYHSIRAGWALTTNHTLENMPIQAQERYLLIFSISNKQGEIILG